MGDRLVASLVPPRTAPGARAEREARPTIAVAPLPVVDIAVLPRQGSLHYGMGHIDTSGRVSDKSMLRALRWRQGR